MSTVSNADYNASNSDYGSGEGKCPYAPKPAAKKIERVLRISVFFDGTLNSRYNTLARQQNTKKYQDLKKKWLTALDSFDNDLTNVSILESDIKIKPGKNYSLYIEGIGTNILAGDSTVGKAIGAGDTGIQAKVDSAIGQIAGSVIPDALSADDGNGDSEPNTQEVISLVFNAFGFSRGAAAARVFVNDVQTDKKQGKFKEAIAEPRSLKDVKVNFVGLFDTVASYGTWSSPTDFKKNATALPVNKLQKAKMVVQLAASDEYRKNFSLSNIKSAGGAGRQIFLPGAHSDIGGGYGEGPETVITIKAKKDGIDRDKAWLRGQGWARRDDELVVVREQPSSATLAVPEFGIDIYEVIELYEEIVGPTYLLSLVRTKVAVNYSRIPLHLMAQFGKDGGVEWMGMLDLEKPVPKDDSVLANLERRLNAYAKSCGAETSKSSDWTSVRDNDMVNLRNKYLHFSGNYNTAAAVLTPNEPNIDAGGQRTRDIYEG